jgi:hypothetical protein
LPVHFTKSLLFAPCTVLRAAKLNALLIWNHSKKKLLNPTNGVNY